MIRISCESNIRQLSKGLSSEIARQVAFASMLAVNAVAKDVQMAEQSNMQDELDKPTPFTLKSVAIKKASKRDPVAIVYMRDIAAAYLEPFVVGGLHKLIGKGKTWLNPKGVALNKYGNISSNTLATLRSRSDVYIGPVKTKHGIVNGVWQRTARAATYVTKTGKTRKVKKAALHQGGGLKLLMRFGDAMPVKQRLHWGEQARGEVGRMFNLRFRQAMARALATRK